MQVGGVVTLVVCTSCCTYMYSSTGYICTCMYVLVYIYRMGLDLVRDTVLSIYVSE